MTNERDTERGRLISVLRVAIGIRERREIIFGSFDIPIAIWNFNFQRYAAISYAVSTGFGDRHVHFTQSAEDVVVVSLRSAEGDADYTN